MIPKTGRTGRQAHAMTQTLLRVLARNWFVTALKKRNKGSRREEEQRRVHLWSCVNTGACSVKVLSSM